MKATCTLLSILGLACLASGSSIANKPLPPAAPSPSTRTLAGITPLEVPKISCTAEQNYTKGPQTRHGRTSESLRWKAFNIYIDEAYTDDERQIINNGAYELSQAIPCLSFGIWPRGSTPSGDYVHIVKSTNLGCNSYIGRQGGRQNINLEAPGCMIKTLVMHEMIHALGFEHEHERPDRDDYINVFLDNVSPGQEHNFKTSNWNYVTVWDFPYDYLSIMQYHSTAFSKNGQPTMLKKNGETIYYNYDLTNSDIQKLKLMYKC